MATSTPKLACCLTTSSKRKTPPQLLFEFKKPRDARLMQTLDAVNDGLGKEGLVIGSEEATV